MKYWVLILISTVIQGCRTHFHYKNEFNKVNESYNSWIYKQLKNSQKLRVLLFEKKRRIDLMIYPNFLIGINNNGDTIAVIDKDYENNLIPKNDVMIKQCYWTSYEIEMLKPLLTVYKKKEYNILYSSVDTVFYGCITE